MRARPATAPPPRDAARSAPPAAPAPPRRARWRARRAARPAPRSRPPARARRGGAGRSRAAAPAPRRDRVSADRVERVGHRRRRARRAAPRSRSAFASGSSSIERRRLGQQRARAVARRPCPRPARSSPAAMRIRLDLPTPFGPVTSSRAARLERERQPLEQHPPAAHAASRRRSASTRHHRRVFQRVHVVVGQAEMMPDLVDHDVARPGRRDRSPSRPIRRGSRGDRDGCGRAARPNPSTISRRPGGRDRRRSGRADPRSRARRASRRRQFLDEQHDVAEMRGERRAAARERGARDRLDRRPRSGARCVLPAHARSA